MQSLGTPRYAAPPCLPSAAAVGTPPTPGAAAAARLSLATTLTSSSPLVAQRCCAITPPVTPLVTPLVTPHPRAPATGTSPGLACGLRPDNGSSTCASGAVAAGCLRPGSHRPRSRCYLYCTGTPPRSSRVLRETLATKIRQIRRWRGVARAPHDGQPGLAANSASAGPLVPDAFCGGTPTQKMEVYPVHGPTPCTGTTSLHWYMET
jgi:hypothetical protein